MSVITSISKPQIKSISHTVGCGGVFGLQAHAYLLGRAHNLMNSNAFAEKTEV